MKLLYFLPSLAVIASIAFDAATIFWIDAAFRLPHEPLLDHIGKKENPWIAGSEGTALVIATLMAVMSLQILRFENGTERVLRQYHGKIAADRAEAPVWARGPGGHRGSS